MLPPPSWARRYSLQGEFAYSPSFRFAEFRRELKLAIRVLSSFNLFLRLWIWRVWIFQNLQHWRNPVSVYLYFLDFSSPKLSSWLWFVAWSSKHILFVASYLALITVLLVLIVLSIYIGWRDLTRALDLTWLGLSTNGWRSFWPTLTHNVISSPYIQGRFSMAMVGSVSRIHRNCYTKLSMYLV